MRTPRPSAMPRSWQRPGSGPLNAARRCGPRWLLALALLALPALPGCLPRVDERHRHRFEFNNAYRDTFKEHGMVFSGLSPDGKLVEIVELADHPYMVASQFHPEFLSRPMKPHPLFAGLLKAAKERSKK